MGVVFDLNHIPLIAEKCLDITATPKNIKSGFNNENQCSDNDDSDIENQRLIVESGVDIETVAHEEVPTIEVASTSDAISSASLREALKEVQGVKQGVSAKKSNPGRKPMKTAILTSPEVVCELKEKADAKCKKLEKRSRIEDGKLPVAKKTAKTSTINNETKCLFF
ncbi:hypothetical protein ABEB36_009242 [Hypothenemus hampei]|uniref:Uncharacterized protein n=1 Tax=Hypothenemus hampei TaxID=57062 RepID=A0ABD1EHU7_HYPHA